MTYTYAILDVSPPTYTEVHKKLEAAGYQQAFHERPEGAVIDMHGIALRAEPGVQVEPGEDQWRPLCPETLRWCAHQLHAVGFQHGVGRVVDSPLLKDINTTLAKHWNRLEGERRTAQCWYFGTWEGPGHYFWDHHGRSTLSKTSKEQPFGYPDGTYQPDNGQEEGPAALRHKDGWTILAWWDRSQDKRGGCCGALVLEGEHGFESMVEALKVRYPTIHGRLKLVPFYGKTVKEAGRR